MTKQVNAKLLPLQGVHTHIGAYHILHGVDLTVPRGQLTMLLGRNGAGKTTLTEMLSKHYKWIPQFEDVDPNPNPTTPPIITHSPPSHHRHTHLQHTHTPHSSIYAAVSDEKIIKYTPSTST